MIPKIVHYCWFGKGKMPKSAIKCMKSWKKYLPDYHLREWNEDTFDINSNIYVKEAYNARKFAFVTDYVRLYALYAEGGVYMDTDVEILKNIDCFLDLPAFSGFEDDTHIPTGIMASEKNGEWVKWQLKYYIDRHFILSDGTLDITTNVLSISKSMADRGFVLENGVRNFEDMITIFPKEYFCPKSHITGEIHLAPNTYAIHHFAGSWLPQTFIRRFSVRLIGTKMVDRLSKVKKKVITLFE